MASRADFRIGLVIGDVFVTRHAALAVRPHFRFMDVVARGALGVTLSDGYVGQSVEARQLGDFVTPGARGLGRDRATVRLVASHALTVSFGTP